MIFLTDTFVRNLQPPAKGAKIHRDADAPGVPGTGVTGFGIRITAAGFRAFVLEYRSRETGDQRVFTIGRFPTIKTERAREKARNLRAEIEDGLDPQAERVAKRHEATVHDLADRFEREHLPLKKPSTAESYSRLLRLYIRPHLGRMRISTVTQADTERLCRAVTEAAGPYQANRVQAVGSKLFGIQSWVALPRDAEESAPNFAHHDAHALPVIEDSGKSVRLVVGSAFGKTSPVQTASEMIYADIALEAGAQAQALEALVAIEQHHGLEVTGVEEVERARTERVDDVERWIGDQDRSARCRRRWIVEEVDPPDVTPLRIDIREDHLAASLDCKRLLNARKRVCNRFERFQALDVQIDRFAPRAGA